jgi:hypothetical protein
MAQHFPGHPLASPRHTTLASLTSFQKGSQGQQSVSADWSSATSLSTRHLYILFHCQLHQQNAKGQCYSIILQHIQVLTWGQVGMRGFTCQDHMIVKFTLDRSGFTIIRSKMEGTKYAGPLLPQKFSRPLYSSVASGIPSLIQDRDSSRDFCSSMKLDAPESCKYGRLHACKPFFG